ncbi:S8 family peptidase [Bacillus testis]|uniref:S8 family peptidase n=1 Tax=Bacillus testis TaxID=1622072 RepID=UPI00067F63D9|nr:S8 family peptidase [Bacillus testis]
MKKSVRLFPHQVEEVVMAISEVPEGLELIQTPYFWEKSKGKGMVVAILDTGCDLEHPDLKDRIIGGRNFTDDDSGRADLFKDYNGHGTHVAGTVAATENGTGVVGVAPEASLLIVKVLDKNGSGTYDSVIQGIQYAVEQRADIISMSLGGPEDMPELHQAIKEAVDQGILVVCAAGNGGDGDPETEELDYPGCYNEVISVGAVDFDRRSSRFSNSNNELDLVAPGEKIRSTYLNGKYATLSGTSMATPHVSGALALLKQYANESFGRQLTEAELYAQLIKRTIPLGYSPRLIGNGLLYLSVDRYLEQLATEKIDGLYVKAE